MSLFNRIARAAHGPLATIGGDAVALVPMARTTANGEWSLDVSRAVISPAIAIISTVPVLADQRLANDPRASVRTPVSGSEMRAEIDVQSLAWVPRSNDRIYQIDTGEWFSLSDPRPDGHGHTSYAIAKAAEVSGAL